MKRTKRTIKDSFPECSVPRAELEKIFAEMREQRLAAQRTGVSGRTGTVAKSKRAGKHVSTEHELPA
jgi:hypothetical protein